MSRLLLVFFLWSLSLCSFAAVNKKGPSVSYPSSNKAQASYSNSGSDSNNRHYVFDNETGAVVTDGFSVSLGGQNLPVTAARSVSKAAVAAAAVRAAAGGWAGVAVGVGSVLYDYYKSAGLEPDSSSPSGLSERAGGQTPASFSYRYPSRSDMGVWGNATVACEKTHEWWRNSWLNSVNWILESSSVAVISDAPSTPCAVSYRQRRKSDGQIVEGVQTDTWIRTAVVNQCVNPDGSLVPTIGNQCAAGVLTHVSGPTAQQRLGASNPPDLAGAARETVAAGESIESGPTSLSGPSSSPEPKTTTTTGPSGTTTTTTTNNYNYAGDTVSYTTTTTTTVTNNNGEVVSTETTVDDRPEGSENVSPPSNPEMPEVPELYAQQYPDGFAGVWADRSAQLAQTPLFSFLASLVPSIGDGGCPSWQLPVMYGIGNYSSVDISVPCWVWSAIRAIIMVTALLACRRIIFGG